MPIINHKDLRDMTREIFEKSGAPAEEARIISDHLVNSNLSGHDSHGVIFASRYARGMQKGVVPSNEYEIVKETPATAVIDARGGLGIVAAYKAMELAIEKARDHTFGAVGVHRCSHTGRLGDYPPRAAEQGMVGIVMLNGGGPFVAPAGGTGRMLPPNPISISVPCKDSAPIMLDITMSVVAGGKIVLKQARGERLPEGWMIDRNGKPVTDPSAFRDGENLAAVLPLGSPQFSHKGFGLGFIIDCLAGGLTWAGCTREGPTRGGNGFLAMAIKIEDFISLEDFQQEVEYLIEWVKSSPKLPGVEEIYVPGEIENRCREERLRDGIYIEDATWKELTETAKSLDVDVPSALNSE